MFRYKLRALLILLAVGPPIVAVLGWLLVGQALGAWFDLARMHRAERRGY